MMLPPLSYLDDCCLLESLKEECEEYIHAPDGVAINGFTAPDGIVRQMIDELIKREVYPAETVPGNPNTVYDMVECYGAYWHKWESSKDRLECPYCEADFRNHVTGPPFVRQVGIYSRAKDRTIGWKCPDCKKQF